MGWNKVLVPCHSISPLWLCLCPDCDWISKCLGRILSQKQAHWDTGYWIQTTTCPIYNAEMYQFHVSPWEWWAQPQSDSLGGWSAFPPVWSHLLWKCLHAHTLAWPLPEGSPAMASLQWNLWTQYVVYLARIWLYRPIMYPPLRRSKCKLLLKC